MKTAVIGIFLIMIVGVLYFGKGLVLPVTLAFLLALVLLPVVRALRRRGIPEGVTAVALVVMLAAGLGGSAYTLSGPVSEWIDSVPQIRSEVRFKLRNLRKSVEDVRKAQEQINEAIKQPTDASTQEVVIRDPGLLDAAASSASQVVAAGGLTLVLLVFLLSSGDMLQEKLVRVLPTLTDKKHGLAIAKEIERSISTYLFTISIINVCLGAFIAAGMFAIGMPNPILWGVAAALLNFVPYLGSIIGIGVVSLVALISFPTLGHAVLAPLIYFVCTTIEGQVITPLLVGRRLQINTVAVLLAVAFWGFIWGFVGVLIAVPLLVVIKVFSSRIESLSGLNEFLSMRGGELER
jgi:predicted PurR-regulated permease PerM